MPLLEAFNEVLELAISFRQKPRHKVHPARGIVSARWRIFDFLADFEFMKHVQLALLDGRLGSPGPPFPRAGHAPGRGEPTETFIYIAGWR
jgi:hypothetical protein